MKNEYIVTTHKDVDQNDFVKLLRKHDIDINDNFSGLERHYYVSFAASKFEMLLAEPEILHIAPAEAPVKLMATQSISVDASGYGGNWGLTRICKRDEWNDSTWYPNSGTYTYFRTGKDVDVYVVDTGARLTHADFEDRISVVYDHYKSSKDARYGVDEHGHGTHVASTVAGKKYGVAKEARILVSRVFETGGATLTAIISGINGCLVHHNQKKANGINRPSVMNLSLGGPAHTTEEQAINDCIDAGIVVVAAAGNDGKDLAEPGYDVMPAEIARAVTVGAADIQDRAAPFSNYGYMVDVFAPGMYITAAGFERDNDESMLSGTSMASPHVAGICALKLQGNDAPMNGALVKEVHDWIWNNATKNTLHLNENVTSVGTANRSVFSDFLVAEEEPVTEVSRTIEDVVETSVTRDPVTTTIFEDTTETVTNPDGSTTTTATRHYTDTNVITVTTTTTTTPITTITYSDGSTEVITGEPTVNVAVTEEISIVERTEIISKETTPAPEPEPTPDPTPEPTPEPEPEPTPDPTPEPEPTPEPAPEPEPAPDKPKKEKKDRRWRRLRGTSTRRFLRLIDNMTKRAAGLGLDTMIEELEDAAETVVTSRKLQRVDAYYAFIDKLREVMREIVRAKRAKRARR